MHHTSARTLYTSLLLVSHFFSRCGRCGHVMLISQPAYEAMAEGGVCQLPHPRTCATPPVYLTRTQRFIQIILNAPIRRVCCHIRAQGSKGDGQGVW